MRKGRKGKRGIRLRIMPIHAVVLSAAFLLSTGCLDAEDDGRTSVTFWHSFVSATIPSLNELLERFEAKHPDIRIKAQYVPTGDGLIQKLVAAVQSGTAPDIAWIHTDFLDKLVLADAIYPMRVFLQRPDGLSEEELADFFPGLLQNASWRDTLYALPMEATSLGLLYNKDLFRSAGLDPERPPRTWRELEQYARRLTVDRDGDGRIEQFGFQVPVYPASGSLNVWMVLQWSPFVWQAGGDLINLEQTRVLYNETPGVVALTFWKRMYDDLGVRDVAVSHDAGFAGQRFAMILDGPWDLPKFRSIKDFAWAVAPLPVGPAGAATYLAGEHLAIFKQTQHPDEAWTFLRWVVQPETQAQFSASSGYLPVRQSVLDMAEYRSHLEQDAPLRVFVEQMTVARARRPIDFHHVEINRHIAEAIERTAVGNENPASALNEAAAKSNKLLESVVR